MRSDEITVHTIIVLSSNKTLGSGLWTGLVVLHVVHTFRRK